MICRENQDNLIKLLINLSSRELIEDADINNVIQEFSAIYEPEDFRHSYSDIFRLVAMLYMDEEGQGESTIYFLNNNLSKCMEYFEENKYCGTDKVYLKRQIYKLYDHINLDVCRIDYINELSNQYIGDYREIVDGIETLYKQQKKTEEKLNDSQKNYITILGIFSSITLMFVAGISFSTSILKGMADVSIFRLITVAIIIGVGIANLTYMLLAYMDRYTKLDEKEPFFSIKKFNLAGGVIVILTMVAWWLSKRAS